MARPIPSIQAIHERAKELDDGLGLPCKQREIERLVLRAYAQGQKDAQAAIAKASGVEEDGPDGFVPSARRSELGRFQPTNEKE